MFVFNPDLLLHRISGLPAALLIFTMAVFGAFAFTNAVQGWFLRRNRWYEVPLFLLAAFIFFYPGFFAGLLGIGMQNRFYLYSLGFVVYGAAYMLQKMTPASAGAASQRK